MLKGVASTCKSSCGIVLKFAGLETNEAIFNPFNCVIVLLLFVSANVKTYQNVKKIMKMHDQCPNIIIIITFNV